MPVKSQLFYGQQPSVLLSDVFRIYGCLTIVQNKFDELDSCVVYRHQRELPFAEVAISHGRFCRCQKRHIPSAVRARIEHDHFHSHRFDRADKFCFPHIRLPFMYLDSQKIFCNILFLLAFLAKQNIFWSRPVIYSNLLTLLLATKNEEPGTLNSQVIYQLLKLLET